MLDVGLFGEEKSQSSGGTLCSGGMNLPTPTAPHQSLSPHTWQDLFQMSHGQRGGAATLNAITFLQDLLPVL